MPRELLGHPGCCLWWCQEPGWPQGQAGPVTDLTGLCESHVSPAGGSSRAEMWARSEERDVGGKVGSQGLSVLSVQCYSLLPGLLPGSQQCPHSTGNARFL